MKLSGVPRQLTPCGRPGGNSGARIETIYDSRGDAIERVAPEETPGRGLKPERTQVMYMLPEGAPEETPGRGLKLQRSVIYAKSCQSPRRKLRGAD